MTALLRGVIGSNVGAALILEEREHFTVNMENFAGGSRSVLFAGIMTENWLELLVRDTNTDSGGRGLLHCENQSMLRHTRQWLGANSRPQIASQLILVQLFVNC